MEVQFVSAPIVDLPIGKPLELKKALALFDRANQQLSLDEETSEITFQLLEAEEVLVEATVELPKESFNLLQEIETELNEAAIEAEGRDALLAFIASRFPKEQQKGRKPKKKEKKAASEPEEVTDASTLAIVFLENEDTELPTEQLMDLREGIALLNKENQRLEKSEEPLELDYQLLHEDVLFYESTLFLPEETFDFRREIQQELADADGSKEDIDELMRLLDQSLESASERKAKPSQKITKDSLPVAETRPKRKPLRLQKESPEKKSVQPSAPKKEAQTRFGGFFSSRAPFKPTKKTNEKGKKKERASPVLEAKASAPMPSKSPKEKQESRSGNGVVTAVVLAFCVWSVCLLGVCVYVLHQQANEQAARLTKLQQTTPATTDGRQESSPQQQTQTTDTEKQTQIDSFARLFLTKFYNRQDNDEQYRKQLGAWIDSKDLKEVHNPDEEAAAILPWKIEQSGDHWNVAYLVQSQSNEESHLVTFQVTESAVEQFQVNSPITQTSVSVNHVK